MTSMSHVTTAWMWELSATLIEKVICNKVLFVLNLYIIREVNLLPTERSVTIINFRGGKFVSLTSIPETATAGVIVVSFEH